MRDIYMPPMDRAPLLERIRLALKLLRAKHTDGGEAWL